MEEKIKTLFAAAMQLEANARCCREAIKRKDLDVALMFLDDITKWRDKVREVSKELMNH